MGNSFGLTYIVPLLDRFLEQYPHISPDWHFDNRPVDLIGENFDAAIGGGFDISPRVVARDLGPAHRVLVASPQYLSQRPPVKAPAELANCDGILVRSPQTGRVRAWPLRNRAGQQAPIQLRQHITMSDGEAVCRIAEMGLGIGLTSMPHALPYLDDGRLLRVLPDWYVDGGMLALYFPAQSLLPAKTRAFVDFVVAHFRQEKLAQRFSALA
jgi:DNA-binding transcriptional LysR family regulator